MLTQVLQKLAIGFRTLTTFRVKILKIPYIKELILAHKHHHYKNGKILKDIDDNYKNYGFTTLYWDKVYGTYK